MKGEYDYMTKGYRIMISILAILFSVWATGIGCALVVESSLRMGIRLVCDFFFIMQSIATCWVVIAMFKKRSLNNELEDV